MDGKSSKDRGMSKGTMKDCVVGKGHDDQS